MHVFFDLFQILWVNSTHLRDDFVYLEKNSSLIFGGKDSKRPKPDNWPVKYLSYFWRYVQKFFLRLIALQNSTGHIFLKIRNLKKTFFEILIKFWKLLKSLKSLTTLRPSQPAEHDKNKTRKISSSQIEPHCDFMHFSDFIELACEITFLYFEDISKFFLRLIALQKLHRAYFF